MDRATERGESLSARMHHSLAKSSKRLVRDSPRCAWALTLHVQWQDRLMLLENWIVFERQHGSEEQLAQVQKRLPTRVTRRRPMVRSCTGIQVACVPCCIKSHDCCCALCRLMADSRNTWTWCSLMRVLMHRT
jgi:hypothetical protein